MGRWQPLYCDRHPERVALERCEVCGRALCAYCLYYTEDGQRLCAVHAEEARLLGVRIEAPQDYAEQLLGAQVGIGAKVKRSARQDEEGLYRGNSTDLVAFIGMLTGVITLGLCCGVGYCLPLVGFVLSLVAVLNASKAVDPKRTRRLGVIGLLVSSIWVAALVLVIFALVIPLSRGSAVVVSPLPPGYLATALQNPPSSPTRTPTPTPGITPRPSGENAAAAWSLPPS
jgi:hypothetical protein